MLRINSAVLVFGLLIASLTTGCLRSLVTVTVHRDGSATIRDTMLFAPRFIAMMASMDQNMSGEEGEKKGSEPFKLWNDSTLRADARDFAPSVKLSTWEEVTIDGMDGYVAVYEAPSVNELTLDGDRGTSKVKTGQSPEEEESSGKDTPWTLSYTSGNLTITAKTDLDSIMNSPIPAEATEEQSDEELKQTVDMMAGFLRGMLVSLRVEVDGAITSTNALYADATSVTLLYMDFDKLVDVWEADPKTFRDFDKMKEGDTKSINNMINSYPKGSMLFETQPKVTVAF